MVATTEKAWRGAGTSLDVIVTAALPTADFAAARDITMSKQKAVGVPEDREGVGVMQYTTEFKTTLSGRAP